jgi:Type II secretory pathway, component HofQ
VREFQGDDVGQVLRLLARQAKINMVVSDQVTGTVTMRLEDVTALQAVAIIVKAKGLFMDQIDHVYYIKTPAEKTAEPTESDNYQFSTRAQKKLHLCWHHNFQAKIPLNSTSAPTPFSSARRAATSTLCANCW